ncbi:MAG: hypothetical protein ACLTG4_07265 [Oscillospiraceae bacterium]
MFAIAPATAAWPRYSAARWQRQAWLSIIRRNNFAHHRHVRGASARHLEEIEREARARRSAGYHAAGAECSYGCDLDEDVDFADLHPAHNAIPGDFPPSAS